MLNSIRKIILNGKTKKTEDSTIREIMERTEKISEDARIEYENNMAGIEAEKSGDDEAAIRFYEDNVARKSKGSHAYSRLAVIYRKRKDYANEIRVIERYMLTYSSMEDFLGNSAKNRKMFDRLTKARILRDKNATQSGE